MGNTSKKYLEGLFVRLSKFGELQSNAESGAATDDLDPQSDFHFLNPEAHL